MSSNIFQIKRGNSVPADNTLANYELGYVKSENKLYIGVQREDNIKAIEISDVYIGDTPPTDGYKIWIDTSEEFLVPIINGGTGARNNVIAMRNLIRDQYGDTLPQAGNVGRIFFLKV